MSDIADSNKLFLIWQQLEKSIAVKRQILIDFRSQPYQIVFDCLGKFNVGYETDGVLNVSWPKPFANYQRNSF